MKRNDEEKSTVTGTLDLFAEKTRPIMEEIPDIFNKKEMFFMANLPLKLTKRYSNVQELLERFANGDEEVIKVEIDACYSSPNTAYHSIRRAAIRSEYKIGVILRKGKVFLVKD